MDADAHCLSPVQQELNKLLSVFISVCETHNLCYYAIDGTLLGAIRHSGFIPWDDDVDVAMPRPDYDRLLQLSDSLPTGYRFTNSEELLFGTFEDTRLPITHGNTAWDERQPFLSVDVFPLDGTPSCPLARKAHQLHCWLLFGLIKLKRIQYIQSTEASKNRANRSSLEKVLIKHGKILGCLIRTIDEAKLVESFFRQSKRHPYDGSRIIGMYCGRYRARHFFPAAYVGASQTAVFEGNIIRTYERIDDYLARIYGPDYMTPPPACEREHHGNLRLARVAEQRTVPDNQSHYNEPSPVNHKPN